MGAVCCRGIASEAAVAVRERSKTSAANFLLPNRPRRGAPNASFGSRTPTPASGRASASGFGELRRPTVGIGSQSELLYPPRSLQLQRSTGVLALPAVKTACSRRGIVSR
jgi:hypothetical protein